jgi:hypothetical protein
METFPGGPYEPYSPEADSGQIDSFEPFSLEATLLHGPDNSYAPKLPEDNRSFLSLSQNPELPTYFLSVPPIARRHEEPEQRVQFYPEPRKKDIAKLAGLMTEVFLDVALPFDWPRSEMTVSPGADINNPATEPNRKPSWHEYFESGPPEIDGWLN